MGLGEGAVEWRVHAGALQPLFRGVYAVGHSNLTVRGRWLGAVLACGEGAMLSHRSAAGLWGLRVGGTRIEVTAERGNHGGATGVLLHRTRALHPDDRAVRDGVPVTSLGRTLVDLGGVVDRRRLERAYEDAGRLPEFDLRALEAACARANGKRGVRSLRALVDERHAAADTRSELERRFANLVRRARLPRPVFNTLVEGYEVDVVWRDARLVVELDSWRHHGDRRAFEQDRVRDAALQLAGYTVVRITRRRLIKNRGEVIDQLRVALSTPGATASGRAPRAAARGAHPGPGP